MSYAQIKQLIAAIFVATYALPMRADTCFDDKKLHQLQRNSQAIVLYVWSPRMLLSAQHAQTVQRQAHELGMTWVALHDPRVGEAEITATRERLQRDGLAASSQALRDSQPLCSGALESREASRHFPTALVMNAQGSLHPHPIVGAMPRSAWRESLRLRLAARSLPQPPQP